LRARGRPVSGPGRRGGRSASGWFVKVVGALVLVVLWSGGRRATAEFTRAVV
jgi:hypothetical protein